MWRSDGVAGVAMANTVLEPRFLLSKAGKAMKIERKTGFWLQNQLRYQGSCRETRRPRSKILCTTFHYTHTYNLSLVRSNSEKIDFSLTYVCRTSVRRAPGVRVRMAIFVV